MDQLYESYSLSSTTKDFIGHAISLHRDDAYLTQPASETVPKMQLYFQSMLRYGKSPYIYPMYGLGELPQAFARLSAVYGGTYMLRKPFHGVVLNDEGKVVGVKSENNEVAKCKFVVGDPSYFPEKTRKAGQIVRCICFLSAPPIAGISSAQIIIPSKQVNRKSDIYVSYLSNAHHVVPNGKYLAICAALVETENPQAELEPGIKVLGKGIIEKFYSVTDLFEPTSDGTQDKIFISKSFDQTSHFETTCDDILDMYKRITGKELDLNVNLDALRENS